MSICNDVNDRIPFQIPCHVRNRLSVKYIAFHNLFYVHVTLTLNPSPLHANIAKYHNFRKNRRYIMPTIAEIFGNSPKIPNFAIPIPGNARMAELVDALDSKSNVL